MKHEGTDFNSLLYKFKPLSEWVISHGIDSFRHLSTLMIIIFIWGFIVYIIVIRKLENMKHEIERLNINAVGIRKTS